MKDVQVVERLSVLKVELESQVQILSLSVAFTFAQMSFEKAWIHVSLDTLSYGLNIRLHWAPLALGSNQFKRRKTEFQTVKNAMEICSGIFSKNVWKVINKRNLWRFMFAYILMGLHVKKPQKNIKVKPLVKIEFSPVICKISQHLWKFHYIKILKENNQKLRNRDKVSG